MDNLSREERSRLMSRVRSKDTRPEMAVRHLVHGMGFRYRLHRRDLPGSPDLVFLRLRKVMFVHGCFWHSHGCRRAGRLPTSNGDFWRAKLSRNAERDASNQDTLRGLGWEVLIVWECEIRDIANLKRRIACFLSPDVSKPPA
jgi:DNA mismatch endonuclease (patch repair protein)